MPCPRSSRNVEDGHPVLELRKRSYREAARSKETPVNKAINKANQQPHQQQQGNQQGSPWPVQTPWPESPQNGRAPEPTDRPCLP